MGISNKKEEIEYPSILPRVTQPHPWLVMCHGVNKERQTFFSISQNRYYAENIHELANKKIVSSYMEWLVLADFGTEEYSLLNIISKEKIKLPKLDHISHSCCHLTCPPEDPSCRVLFITCMTQNNISICRPGDDKYISKKVRRLEGGDYSFYSPACFGGNIYLIGYPSLSLNRANINDPTLKFQTVINGESMQEELLDSSSYPYLIESCGEILVATMSTLHEEARIFHVFRAEFSTSKWVLLKSIGDRAIFLGSLSSQGISCSSSESGIRGNCIYFITQKNRTLYIFDVEDQSSMVTIPCPNINPINLMPQWVMIDSLDKCV